MPRALCSRTEAALAHRDNGRRLMTAALDLFDDGFVDAGETLRTLARYEYARALAMLEPAGQIPA